MAIRAEDLPHFSVDEYLVLAEAAPEALERTELIDGVIYRVSPESFLHAVAVKWIFLQLEKRCPGRVLPGGSVRVSDASTWAPDVWVLRHGVQVEEERGSYPSFTQVGWVIEVSLTTHQRDLGVKLRDYAWAGVSEYWVVNPEKGGWLLAHTDPGDGTYRLSIEQWDVFLASLERPSRYRPEVARLLATKLPDDG
jgi:Uma2 family endonuclease